jgi:hypothetical protein
VRSTVRAVGLKFWPPRHPLYEGTIVNFELTRQLYRNSGDAALGTAFAKPIVDLQVQFMGLPLASTGDEAIDTFLNECLHTYWVDEIQQGMRDSIRDSLVIIRLQQPDLFDPLMTIEEQEHCTVECIAPERVQIERDVANKRIIRKAIVSHRMQFVTDPGSVTEGREPIVEEHEVLEIITRDTYRFFDQNTNEYIDSLGAPNRWNFVPLLEAWNEWDTALQGGMSDLETVIPFMQAFHDVLTQGLQAHKYHSTPKLKLRLSDVLAFIRANFPDIIDPETGDVIPNATINWNGREVLFFQAEDDAGFIEAKSVLNDTKTLLEFLIDCICIASQTPEWAFMRVDSGSANSDRNAQTVPFVKKIDRKRNGHAKWIQELCKMVLVSQNEIPHRPTITWQMIRVDDEVLFMQAFQQLVMGLEVAAARGEISDETYRKMIKQFLPAMKNTTQEAIDAQRDFRAQQVQQAALNPAPTQPLPVQGGPQGSNE